MNKRDALALAAALLIGSGWAAAQQIGPPPSTERTPVTDTYHVVSVVDDYRWLENWDDPKVKAWVAAQNAYTQSYVSKLPQRPAIVEFFKKSISTRAATSLGRIVAMTTRPVILHW